MSAHQPPSISVVTPSYQQAAFLERTIQSVLEQSSPPREYLLFDGGSTDGTAQILQKYAGRLTAVSRPDDGQPGAVDRAIRQATGDVIAWLNSDDRFADPGVLSRVGATFAAEPELDIVYGDGLLVDTQGRPLRPSRSFALRDQKQLLLHPTSFVLQPAVFFRRSLYLAAGGIDPSLHYAFDYDLWLRMFPAARQTRYLSETLAHATAHPQAKSVRNMGTLIRQTIRVKRRYVAAYQLSAIDRFQMNLGIAKLYAYLAAVRLGLRRAA